jgi:hypothetical protein
VISTPPLAEEIADRGDRRVQRLEGRELGDILAVGLGDVLVDVLAETATSARANRRLRMPNPLIALHVAPWSSVSRRAGPSVAPPVAT